MKKNRAEKKDLNDCMLMEAFLSDSHSKKFLATLKQKLLFTKVKVRKSIVDIIKFMGVYSFIKKMRDNSNTFIYIVGAIVLLHFIVGFVWLIYKMKKRK